MDRARRRGNTCLRDHAMAARHNKPLAARAGDLLHHSWSVRSFLRPGDLASLGWTFLWHCRFCSRPHAGTLTCLRSLFCDAWEKASRLVRTGSVSSAHGDSYPKSMALGKLVSF